MPARKYLTDAGARTMTRRELVDRIYAEMDHWKARRPRTEAQRAAYAELVRIMYAYTDPAAGLTSVRHYLEGQPDGYWETPVASLPPLSAPAGPDTTQVEQAMTARARRRYGPALAELRDHEE
jgi:hypothetical protein